ncbi:MAG: hypothetical protein Barrevirus1_9 [Barrevirus sp.]|uniref:Uncharacterized protein n=1 Tax=Barrevirus sp. TaxID=2487763 RepID=A0A3G4ZPH5_9VIRU|nr:MAG: hypothetical protein Barrevirus1_9 [Barrevirus sp.]
MDYPNDIIQHIYQIVSKQSGSDQFDINTLWPSFFKVNTVKAISTFVKLGANIDYRVIDTGSTPVMYFAQLGLTNIVIWLIEQGADLTVKNMCHNTVYNYAVQGKINLDPIIKTYQEKKEKEELISRNKALEEKCLEMDNKLSQLLNLFNKMNIELSSVLPTKDKKEDDKGKMEECKTITPTN